MSKRPRLGLECFRKPDAPLGELSPWREKPLVLAGVRYKSPMQAIWCLLADDIEDVRLRKLHYDKIFFSHTVDQLAARARKVPVADKARARQRVMGVLRHMAEEWPEVREALRGVGAPLAFADGPVSLLLGTGTMPEKLGHAETWRGDNMVGSCWDEIRKSL